MKTILFRCIGIALFLYLLIVWVDIAQLFHELSGLTLFTLLLIVPFHLLQWSLRVLRWQILLRHHSIQLSFGQTGAVAVSGFFFGCLTPGRLGEFAKVKFLMNAGYSFRGAFMSSLLERLFDVFALVIYVLLGIWVSRELLPEKLNGYIVFTLVGMAGLLIAFLMRQRIKIIFLRLIPETMATSLDEKIRIWSQSFKGYSLNQWILIILYSLGIWGLNYWMIYLLFQQMGQTLAINKAFAFAAFGSLAGLVPLSIYGVGIREALLIFFFERIGYTDPANAAFLFGLMFLVVLVYHIILGFIGWMSPAMKQFLHPQLKEESGKANQGMD